MNAYSEDLREKIIEALGRGMGKSEAARTFSVSLSSVKRYARAWSTYVVYLGQGQPTCRDDEGCAPPPDRSPPKCNNPPMARPGQQIAETA
jgi:hypothetical protein